MSYSNQSSLSVIDAIEQRRSVKHYDPSHAMSDEEIHRLIELAATAPTAFNIQPVRYIVVRDKALKEAMAPLAHNQPQVTESSALIFLTGALDAYQNPARYWPDAPAEAQAGIVASITGTYEGNTMRQHDEGVLSVGMAASTLMLAAEALGYDTCPMKGFDYPAAAKLIKVPENEELVLMIAIGKKTVEPHPRSGKLPVEKILRWESALGFSYIA